MKLLKEVKNLIKNYNNILVQKLNLKIKIDLYIYHYNFSILFLISQSSLSDFSPKSSSLLLTSN